MSKTNDDEDVNISEDKKRKAVPEVKNKKETMNVKDKKNEVIVGVEENKDSDEESSKDVLFQNKEYQSNEKLFDDEFDVSSNNKEETQSFQEQHAKLFDQFDKVSERNMKTKREKTVITRKRTRNQEIKNGEKQNTNKMKAKKRMSRR